MADNIKDVSYVSSLETEAEKVRATLYSFNMAHLLLNNLDHLMNNNTTLSTILGTDEAANEYCLSLVARIFSLTGYMDKHLHHLIPACHYEHAKHI